MIKKPWKTKNSSHAGGKFDRFKTKFKTIGKEQWWNKKKYFFIKSNEEEDVGQFTKKVEHQQNIFVWRWNKQQQMFSVRLTVPRYYL